MGYIKVLKPGLLTTIQDKGRRGYQQYGMPTAGAMDEFSLRIGNILVGNNEFEASIETTLIGPELIFSEESIIAITGADLGVMLNDKPINMWRSIKVNKGDVISFARLNSGCRSYIAVAGGLGVEEIMGSKSTYLRGGVGGYKGRPLRKDDVIQFREITNAPHIFNCSIPEIEIPIYSNEYTIRIILGPQDSYFTKEAIETFLNSEYKITNESDRMGYRLSGSILKHTSEADIISDGIAMGSIQVPGHGMPIIMMADRQTTGGYPKIATVVSTDIPILAQAKPGDKITFKSITISKSHKILLEYENKIQRVKEVIDEIRTKSLKEKKYMIKVNGKVYEIAVQET